MVGGVVATQKSKVDDGSKLAQVMLLLVTLTEPKDGMLHRKAWPAELL